MSEIVLSCHHGGHDSHVAMFIVINNIFLVNEITPSYFSLGDNYLIKFLKTMKHFHI